MAPAAGRWSDDSDTHYLAGPLPSESVDVMVLTTMREGIESFGHQLSPEVRSMLKKAVGDQCLDLDIEVVNVEDPLLSEHPEMDAILEWMSRKLGIEGIPEKRLTIPNFCAVRFVGVLRCVRLLLET